MTDRTNGEPATTGSALSPDTLERVRRRDRAAMEIFFEHFFPRAYGYATFLLGDETLAQDLVQDAFLRMHRAIERLDPSRDPAPWVLAVVTNTARDFWRSPSQRARAGSFELEAAGGVADPSEWADPERRLMAVERRSSVERALAALPPPDREVILLRDYEDLTTPQIAAALGMREDAVRQRYSRAVKRLAETFRRLGASPGAKRTAAIRDAT